MIPLEVETEPSPAPGPPLQMAVAKRSMALLRKKRMNSVHSFRDVIRVSHFAYPRVLDLISNNLLRSIR